MSEIAKGAAMEPKIISITSKRQLTIPQKFFSFLGFADEAECFVQNGALVVRPVKSASGGEFAEQILADLLKEGLTGDALLAEFKKRQRAVRPAVEAMIADAKKAAAGQGEYYTDADVWGDDA